MALVFLSPLCVHHQAKADDNKVVAGAEAFINSMAQRAIDFLADEELTPDQRTAKFKKLLQTSFDMKTIGRFALGRYWRTSNEKQRAEYLKLFEKMVIDVYSQRFGEYKGQKVEVRGGRKDGSTDSIISSFILPTNGGQEIEVEWRVRYKNNRYKVIDVIVEGVSMGVTQRSDFASVIQRGGGELKVLLAHLRDK